MNESKKLALFLKTKQRAYLFLEKVDQYTRAAGHSEYIANNFTQDEAEYLQVYNQDISELYKQVSKLPVVTITTAVKPSVTLQEMLTQTIQAALEACLVEWRELPSLVAGAVIEYEGKRYDFSVESKIKDLL